MTATTTDQITSEHLESLRARLRGMAVRPGDDGYDEGRTAWNLNAVHRPALVVLAEGSEDIRCAVEFARTVGLGVGVLATGHGTGTPSDGGLLINTSRMRGVRIDPDARVARVEAGAVWDDVVEVAAVHGLAGLPGSSTKVGVVGYTLGGGFGWLGRRYGLAVHSVLRAEVVTADGQLVTANADEHPELFWGIKGGTGNLGIVTALEFALHPVRQVYGGNLFYPLERAADLLGFFAQWSRSVPQELTSAVTFRTFPPLPTVPEPLRGSRLVALRGCFCGDPADGEALIDQARAALGPAKIDTFAEMPAAALAAISMDPPDRLGFMGHIELLRDLTPGTIDALIDLAGPEAQSPLAMLEVRQLGGAISGPADALSPMAHTDAAFSLNAIGITPTPDTQAAVRAYLKKVEATVRGHATGDTYVNFLDLEGATPERIRAAYSADDWDRLVRLKAHYDPNNVFRFNRNIQIDPRPNQPTESEYDR
jgi:FAD/FMN-containing dehydrogenase